MCVFKNHAFIYFLRPPSWSGTMVVRDSLGRWHHCSPTWPSEGQLSHWDGIDHWSYEKTAPFWSYATAGFCYVMPYVIYCFYHVHYMFRDVTCVVISHVSWCWSFVKIYIACSYVKRCSILWLVCWTHLPYVAAPAVHIIPYWVSLMESFSHTPISLSSFIQSPGGGRSPP
jgi:hypothetical protein